MKEVNTFPEFIRFAFKVGITSNMLRISCSDISSRDEGSLKKNEGNNIKKRKRT